MKDSNVRPYKGLNIYSFEDNQHQLNNITYKTKTKNVLDYNKFNRKSNFDIFNHKPLGG